MIERYYYGRDKKTNAPLVTVCILVKDGTVARGISVCSLSDQPSKEKGRHLAKLRALESIALQTSAYPIHKEERKYIRQLAARSSKSRKQDGLYSFRGEYMPILTGFERNLLAVAENMEENMICPYLASLRKTK